MNEVVNKQVTWDGISCLIVDDDKFSRAFVKTALHQVGVKNAKEATSAEEAIEILQNNHINVVLLDHQMPNQTGIELAKQIKSGTVGNNKDLPIIIVTVDAKEKTVLEAKAVGIHEYLIKPISPLALKKRLATIFGIKERAQ